MAEEMKKDLTEDEMTEENTDTAENAKEPENAEDGQAPEPADETAAAEPSDEGEEQEAEDASAPEEKADAQPEQEKAPARGKKEGFFKKKKDKKDEQIEELQDKLKRQMAEFENFRKRTEKEKSQMFDMGARTIIEKVLPVVDNFERGLAAVSEEQKEDAFVTGMDKVYKQLMTEFESIGVKPIEAEGQEFNPELHNAVMQVENEELASGTVAAELQKGYTYKDTVVRHSMVSVVS